MLQAIIASVIAAGGPVLTALIIEGKRQLWLWRWRRDNFPISYGLASPGVLPTQSFASPGHTVARAS